MGLGTEFPGRLPWAEESVRLWRAKQYHHLTPNQALTSPFLLAQSEFEALMSQIVISKGRGGRRKLPRVFTEHGAIMAATILNRPWR